MRHFSLVLTVCLGSCLCLSNCVDPEDIGLLDKLDVVVVDGTINNLAEPQLIRLERSKSVSGLPGSVPITKAMVDVLVDSGQVIAAHETTDGSYQLPSDFRGQIGHSYQLRFVLSDGTKYTSTPQIMPAVPPITAVHAQFNPTSLAANQLNGYSAGHDVYMDTQDPADQRNYYRWDWNDYEKQDWCRTCKKGVYAVNSVLPGVYRENIYFVSGDSLYEDCFTPAPTPTNTTEFGRPFVPSTDFYYDYACRTQCWEILHSYTLNVFDDQYSNGGQIANRLVAHIPFYTRQPCLIEIRQSSLTPDAYRYVKLFQEQTQNTGGLSDAPPTALVGNVRNEANQREPVVGYFTASGVSSFPYWLDRKDTRGLPYGATGGPVEANQELFYALNLRLPYGEPSPPFIGPRDVPQILIYGGPVRPPTALCTSSPNRTPVKPLGWRD